MPSPFDFTDDSPVRRYDVTHRQGVSAEGCFSMLLKGSAALVLLLVAVYLLLPLGAGYFRYREVMDRVEQRRATEKSNAVK